MERNIVTDAVVPTTTLLAQENYAVDANGIKTTLGGAYVLGIVRTGRPANEASEIIIGGECKAQVAGAGTAVSIGDPLTGGMAGRLRKAIVGTDFVRAMALEAVSTDTTAQVLIL